MESVPETPDNKITRYFLFCRCRNEGYTEGELTAKFHEGSVQRLYCRLSEDGFPVCVECGDYEPEERRCTACLPRNRRRPRGSEENAIELPAASRAADAFQKAVNWLNTANEELSYLSQWLKGGRFVSVHHHPEESGRSNWHFVRADFCRTRLGERDWKKYCSKYGKDPSVEEFRVPIDATFGGGADWYPHDLLVWLITAYAVMGKPMDDLIVHLHPAPSAQAVAEANRKRDEILLRARQLAGLVRGNPEATKPGRKIPKVSVAEQELAWALKNEEAREDYREAGLSRAEITRLRGLYFPATGESDPG